MTLVNECTDTGIPTPTHTHTHTSSCTHTHTYVLWQPQSQLGEGRTSAPWTEAQTDARLDGDRRGCWPSTEEEDRGEWGFHQRRELKHEAVWERAGLRQNSRA